MKAAKDVANPEISDRSQGLSLPPSVPTDLATILTNKVALHSMDTSRETQVRELAFQLYVQHGCRDGHDIEDWLEAEAIIMNQPKLMA